MRSPREVLQEELNALLQADIRHLEERCAELKAASSVHESRASTLEGAGLSSTQVIDKLQVRLLVLLHNALLHQLALAGAVSLATPALLSGWHAVKCQMACGKHLCCTAHASCPRSR